ncbi:DUF1289 domain-containing protein [Thalassotalea euphylliae]|uniref:DUF1289 domain-containing protein n=1 Tax=Thalassotalea euphylliae TaxID=1655234 RepID=A0A3E0UCJ8_9GAMM|nr:DUF1289 domain-containing protein [Thalassotalea euphylliae]REL34718.1 DUF1289 domain-containing protein [Thalassotalea euphylliae]
MQLEFFDVPSPCIGVCQSDEKGHCLGCFRTREERQQWITLSSDDKQKVIKRCVQRKKRKDKAKLTPSNPLQNSSVKSSSVQNSSAESSSQTSQEQAEQQIIQPSLLDPTPKSTAKTTTSSNDEMDFGDFEL